MKYHSFSKEKLEEIAADFRATHAKLDGKRLMVELLVDKLGFELIPVEGLKAEFGIEAYLPKRPNTIIVDKAQMDFGSPRYHMTLTEEIAHSIIHINGYNATVHTLHEWIMSLTEREHHDLEHDARYLAAAILMPREEFAAVFKGYADAQRKALGKHGDRHTIIRYAVRRTYWAYGVSFESVAHRACDLGLIKAHDFTLLKRYRPEAF